mgnify:CR=1 FL=1
MIKLITAIIIILPFWFLFIYENVNYFRYNHQDNPDSLFKQEVAVLNGYQKNELKVTFYSHVENKIQIYYPKSFDYKNIMGLLPNISLKAEEMKELTLNLPKRAQFIILTTQNNIRRYSFYKLSEEKLYHFYNDGTPIKFHLHIDYSREYSFLILNFTAFFGAVFHLFKRPKKKYLLITIIITSLMTIIISGFNIFIQIKIIFNL